MTCHSLLWNEDHNLYELYAPGGKLLGTLPDDTVFAQRVLRAFDAEMAANKVQGRLDAVLRTLETFYREIRLT